MKPPFLLLSFLLFSLASQATIAPITGKASVCVASLDTLRDSTAGGVWSSSNVGVAAVSSTGVVTGMAAGVVTITYTVGAGFQTKTIVVNPLPSPIYGSFALCAGNSITVYDSTPGGGSWFFICDDDLIMLMTSGGDRAELTSSSLIYSFDNGRIRFTDTAGCSTTAEIWAYEPPLPPITGDSIIRVDSATILADVAVGGTWSSSDTSVATVGYYSGAVTGKSIGTTTITYTRGCDAVLTIRVWPPAAVPAIASDKASIMLYPNPVNMDLIVKSADQLINNVAITDLSGQTLGSHEYNSKEVHIDVTMLPVGMYLLRVNNTEVRRFVKE